MTASTTRLETTDLETTGLVTRRAHGSLTGETTPRPGGGVDATTRVRSTPVVLVGASALRRRRLPRSLRRCIGPFSILVGWAVLSCTGIVGRELLPTPQDVMAAGWELAVDGKLSDHLLASLTRASAGLALGLAVGVAVALAAGLGRRSEDVVDSIMQIVKAIPNFSLVPLLIIWFGIDESPKIALVFLSTVVPIYIHTYGGIRNVGAELFDLGSTLELRRRTVIRHLVLPGALPGFLTGLRVALTNAWLALIFAETINARTGLGRLMSDARSYFRLDIMVFVICLYAALGLVSHSFVRLLERTLLVWRPTRSDRA